MIVAEQSANCRVKVLAELLLALRSTCHLLFLGIVPSRFGASEPSTDSMLQTDDPTEENKSNEA